MSMQTRLQGMSFFSLAVLCGNLLFQRHASLPDIPFHPFSQVLLYGLLALAIYAHVVRRSDENAPAFKRYITLIISCILLILIGYVSVYSVADRYQSKRFTGPVDTREFIVTGRVSSLPGSEFSDDRLVYRFDFDIETIDRVDSHESADDDFMATNLQRLRLGWYQATSTQHDDVIRPAAGEKWRLRVRLKPPHGSMNPGGFDYQRWLFIKDIDATGYVREDAGNRLVTPAPVWIDRFRQQLADRFTASSSGDASYADSFALIMALTIGDKSSISQQQWQTLTRTGTSHLMAISGLHMPLGKSSIRVRLR